MVSWETFVTKRTLITLITPISKKIIWASKSFTLIKEVIRCFHKTSTGISDQNIERMLTLTLGIIDVLVISETKLDESFPAGQFRIPGHVSPFRLWINTVEELWLYQRGYYGQVFPCWYLIDWRLIYWVQFSQRKSLLSCLYMMHCAIWYHLHNLKNVKNIHGGVLLLVKLQAKSLRLY